ncbi:MAG: TonB-dependent receptor plug domain-containing protein, partial [Muribaculaceae bacterium]|nr:TonB-dependent receptor plug domain-containing protein [Muribaculaceae bacterium]
MKLFNAFRCLFLTGMVMFFGVETFAQNVTVKGKVSDSSGEPIIGVTVMLSSNNTVGTLTDGNGNYAITIPANSSLTFSCVGFATQEEQLNGRTVINVVLQEDTEFLDETVVVGYGTQKKRLLTGATINITGEDIQKQSTTNALGALYSSVPGVNIVQSSGGPGAGYNITVRGIGTTGSASPLVVIDGVAGGHLEDLNPADIESIDILKDAASAAIYGARAANGVVLVTTRQGKIGEKKATVTFDAYTGIQQPNTNGVHGVTASEYLDLISKAGLHEFDNIESTMPVQMQWIREGKWNGTDWFTESINKNAPNNNMVVGVTGGSDSVRYSFSFSKSYQEGTLGVPKVTYYDRTTVRANTDFTVLKKNNRDVIKLGENVTVSITGSRGMSTGGRGSDVSNLLTKTPLLPAYDLDGSIYTYDKQVRDGWDARDNEVNLLQQQEMKESEGKGARVQGNVYLEVSP